MNIKRNILFSVIAAFFLSSALPVLANDIDPATKIKIQEIDMAHAIGPELLKDYVRENGDLEFSTAAFYKICDRKNFDPITINLSKRLEPRVQWTTAQIIERKKINPARSAYIYQALYQTTAMAMLGYVDGKSDMVWSLLKQDKTKDVSQAACERAKDFYKQAKAKGLFATYTNPALE